MLVHTGVFKSLLVTCCANLSRTTYSYTAQFVTWSEECPFCYLKFEFSFPVKLMERYTSSKFRKLSSSCPVSVLKVFTKCVLHILYLDHGEYRCVSSCQSDIWADSKYTPLWENFDLNLSNQIQILNLALSNKEISFIMLCCVTFKVIM